MYAVSRYRRNYNAIYHIADRSTAKMEFMSKCEIAELSKAGIVGVTTAGRTDSNTIKEAGFSLCITAGTYNGPLANNH